MIKDFEKMMDFKGWYREKHLLPIDKKCEYRYHKDGSEITEDEAEGIFELGYDAAMGALSQIRTKRLS